jgi:phosphoribosyl 1,2-cyclic phosphodiesterase
MTASYKLRIWGARGTVPTPSAHKLRYGGNTSCLAVALSDHEHVILDCGTGVRLLGNSLAGADRDAKKRFHVFFTHYHFDHIEGLALFHPLYDPNSSITFHGFEANGRSVREILESLIRPPYFPVTFADAPSKLDFVKVDGQPITIGDLTISSLPLNHPDGCLSFRLEHGDHRIVYATDHEHGDAQTDEALVEFSKNADYLVYDATYMRAEYEELRRGWGHSTWYAAVKTAIAAGVKTLVLFHHHPDHTDEELERVLKIARKEFPSTEIASEGLELPF